MNAPMGLLAAARRRDYLRRSPFAAGAEASHKEWHHFAVRGPGIDALVNFSLVDDIRPRARTGSELPRMICLLKDEAGWDGDMVQCNPESVVADGGRVDLRFGEHGCWIEAGTYRVRARLERRGIEVDLRMTPEAYPSEANNISVEDGPSINWMVLPRLRAEGYIRTGDRVYELTDAAAYHDHNWGSFRWGRDFAWEWGYALPDTRADSDSVVFVRLSDRGHNTDLMQGLFLWREGKQERVFRDSEISVVHQGFLRPQRVFKLPRVMGLVAPGRVTDVPQTLTVEAAGRGDHARFTFTAEELAQVIIPNDDDLGVTIINEVSGRLTLQGTVNGKDLKIEGYSVCEFLGAQ